MGITKKLLLTKHIIIKMFVLMFLGLFADFSSAVTEDISYDQVKEHCPDGGWVEATYIDFGCIFINTSSHNAVSWDDAYTFCNNLDPRARLTEIHTQEQLDFLNIMLTHEGNNYYWLGGTDQGREGDWYWANTLEPVKEFVWHSGEPNSGNTFNCMKYYHNYDSAADYPCENTQYPLCQIPM